MPRPLVLALALAACLLGAAEPPPAVVDAAQAVPIAVGATMPAATVKDVEGTAVDLATVWAEKPAVLVFYRGSWCPFCVRHLAALGGITKNLEDLGWTLVAISPDQPAKLAPPEPDGIRRLSDQDALLMRGLGLAFTVDEDTRVKYKGYGIDLEEASGRSHFILPVPAVILVDRGGVVRFIHADADYRQRLDPAKVLEAARAHGG